jgi:hypothetical protein
VGALVTFLGAIVPGIEEIVATGCDGWVAGQAHAFTGQILCNGSNPFDQTDTSFGVAGPGPILFFPICNSQLSEYDVKWFIEMGEAGNSSQPGETFS